MATMSSRAFIQNLIRPGPDLSGQCAHLCDEEEEEEEQEEEEDGPSGLLSLVMSYIFPLCTQEEEEEDEDEEENGP